MKQLVPLSIFLILIFSALTFVIPPAVEAGIFGSALKAAVRVKIKELIKERLAQKIVFESILETCVSLSEEAKRDQCIKEAIEKCKTGE